MFFQSEDVYSRHPDIPWQIVENQAMILNPSLGEASEMNDTASWWWKKLDGQNTIATLANEFLEEYEVDGEMAEEEIRGFFDLLLNKSLIQIHE